MFIPFKMEQDNSLVEKILSDIDSILINYSEVVDFEIVPITENKTNKSPVLYENHHLGLEMWCMKHICAYTHRYLLKMKNLIRKSYATSHFQKIKQSLLGAVLVQPDVITFWNMRKDLLEMGILDPYKDLHLTKLVLSYKHKSITAFAHRRWIINKITERQLEATSELLEEELAVAEMASQKAQNNYHAWSHRIWALDNIPGISNNAMVTILHGQFSESTRWIHSNISEHSSFHYRQRLIVYLENYCKGMEDYFISYKEFFIECFKIKSCQDDFLLVVLGKSNYESSCMISLLWYELYYILEDLNKMFPGHETIFYHRRFVIYTLFQHIYKLCNVIKPCNIKIESSNIGKPANIVSRPFNKLNSSKRFNDGNKDNTEKQKRPRLLRSEFMSVECTPLYQGILRREIEFIQTNRTSNNILHVELTRRYENWMQYILQINTSTLD